MPCKRLQLQDTASSCLCLQNKTTQNPLRNLLKLKKKKLQDHKVKAVKTPGNSSALQQRVGFKSPSAGKEHQEQAEWPNWGVMTAAVKAKTYTSWAA